MTYKIPLRLEILRRLTAALEGISEYSGYQSDLTNRVFRGRAVFGHDDPIPMVSILEAPNQLVRENQPTGGGTHGTTWELLIQGFVDADHEHPTDSAYQLLAEVQHRLTEVRKGVDGKAHNILGPWNVNGRDISPILDFEIGAGTVRPPDEISSAYSHFWLTLTIVVAEDMSKPFDY